MSADVVGWALVVLVFALVFLNVLMVGHWLGTPTPAVDVSRGYPPIPVPLPSPPPPPPPPPSRDPGREIREGGFRRNPPPAPPNTRIGKGMG